MAVNLPNQPHGPTHLPPQPNNPPTLNDITNSVVYNQQLLISFQAGVANSVSSNDVGRGEVYKAQLVQAQAGASANIAPPWFAPALAAGLVVGLAPLTRVAHTTYNLACGDGRTRNFKVVPFVNGTLPTAAQPNLPVLTSIDDIMNLTGPEATRYLVGYGLPHQHHVNDRRNAIRIEIGCTAT